MKDKVNIRRKDGATVEGLMAEVQAGRLSYDDVVHMAQRRTNPAYMQAVQRMKGQMVSLRGRGRDAT